MVEPTQHQSTRATPFDGQSFSTIQISRITRQENHDLAYTLGAFAAHTEVGSPTSRRLSFSSRDSNQLSLLQGRLTSLTGQEPSPFTTIIHGMEYQRITICNDEIAHHFYSVTGNNTRVPWEHLETHEELVLYLRGLFDHGGSIQLSNKPGIILNKVAGETLLKDISRVFFKLDIYPLFVPGEMCSLKMLETTEWTRFASKIGASLSQHVVKLEKLTSLPSNKTHYTIADYEAVQALAKLGTLSASSIATLTHIPANTVRDWTARPAMPRAARRYYQLKAIAATMPNSDAITKLYRVLGASSECARLCAEKAPRDAITHTVARYIQGEKELYGDDHTIMRAVGVHTPSESMTTEASPPTHHP